MQVDLPARGVAHPGFLPSSDLWIYRSAGFVDLVSDRCGFACATLGRAPQLAAAQLSAEDAREMVMLGRARNLLALADETQVASVEAQVATAKVCLTRRLHNHQAGTRIAR